MRFSLDSILAPWSMDRRVFKGNEDTGNGGDDDGDKNFVEQFVSDLSMGLGFTEKDQDYVDRTANTIANDPNRGHDDASRYADRMSDKGFEDNYNAPSASTVSASSGDTVSQIALDNNTTIADIKALNPGIDINNIKVGQEIKLTPDSRDEGESIYTGVTQGELDAGNTMIASSLDDVEYDSNTGTYSIGGVDGLSGEQVTKALSGGLTVDDIDPDFVKKLEAAGESDTSALDEIAAADTSDIDVYEPTQETVTAVQDYYTSGPGSPGYTTAVDYTTTSSGEDYNVAAAADDTDIVGGTDFTTYEGETVEVRELPSGTKYYVDMSGNYVALAPEEDVTVDTFSDSEYTTAAGDLPKYDDTILEPGTGGISGIRTGDAMTPQLAAELGVNYFEGDTIQSDDLIRLADLGFDVSQADLTQARSEVPLDVDVTVTTADQGSMADMQNYIEQLNQQVGGATFADLEAAGFDLNQIKEYNDTVGAIPGMPAEGTMLYNTLYGEDQGAFAGVEGGGEPGDAFDYEDYITQGGEFPLGGDDGLPDDFFSTETPDTIILNGQEYAVGYADGAIDPGIANEIRRLELDGFTTSETLGNIAKAVTSPIFQSLGMSVEGLARSGDTTVEAVVEAIQDSSDPIEFLNTFATRAGEGARDVIYNITEAVGGEVPEAVKTFFGEEGTTTVARPEDAEDFDFNMLNTAASGVYESLYDIEQEIYESIPEAFRNTMEANQLVGSYQDLISGNIRTAEGKTFLEAMKDNPGETSAQLLSNIGDVASDLLVLAITRSPGATALFGFGEGSQDARNTFEEDLERRVLSGEFNDDPNFQALVQSEGSIEAATNALYDKFEKYAFGAGGVEAVSDALIYGIGGKLATKVLPNAVTTGAIGTGAAVTGSAVLEGTTEGVQQFVSNVGINDVLAVSDDVGRDVGTAFINALIPGAGAGIVTAATTRFLGPKEMADMIKKAESQTGQDLSQLKNMLTSSDSISVTTDAQGNLQFTNTETNQSVTMPTASNVSAGAAAGTETNVADITAAEILNSGNEVEFTTDNEGNSILTDKVTGDSVNLGSQGVVSTEDTTKITGATGVAGPAGPTGATGAGATTNTLVGNSSVTTSGDVEITTTVDPNGNTIVSTKNTVTGATTSDIVPSGTTSVITNGTTDITVDATTSTATGVTTTAVDTSITTDVTPTVDTDVATDVTPTVDTTPTVTPAVTPTPETEELPGDEDVVADVVDEDVTADVIADDEPDLTGETAPTYTSGIAGMGGGMRPVVAPYYQPQQTGIYSFYTPQPGVAQVPAQPIFSDPQGYLAPTAQPQYGYEYIAPNADIEYLRRLAEIQGTGAERLPSEDLMDGS